MKKAKKNQAPAPKPLDKTSPQYTIIFGNYASSVTIHTQNPQMWEFLDKLEKENPKAVTMQACFLKYSKLKHEVRIYNCKFSVYPKVKEFASKLDNVQIYDPIPAPSRKYKRW